MYDSTCSFMCTYNSYVMSELMIRSRRWRISFKTSYETHSNIIEVVVAKPSSRVIGHMCTFFV